MKRRLTAIVLIIVLLFTCSAYGHSGNTDSSGGHRDNKNASGLGYYHYHCGGHPPHLHYGGVCPYNSSSSSYSPPSKSVYSSPSASVSIKPLPKVQLEKPKIFTSSHKDYIKIYWEDIDHASKYSIYRSTSKNGTYTKIATTTSTSYKDKNVTNEKVYYYKVKAFGSGRYTTSYYSNVSSNYRFKGVITLYEEEEIVLYGGDTYSFFLKATGSNRDLKVATSSSNILANLSKINDDGEYKITIEAINNPTSEKDYTVNVYFTNRKSNSVQSISVVVLPNKQERYIAIEDEYLTIKPGDLAVTGAMPINSNVEITGFIDVDWFFGTVVEDPEVEGAYMIALMANEDADCYSEVGHVFLVYADDLDKTLATIDVILVKP